MQTIVVDSSIKSFYPESPSGAALRRLQHSTVQYISQYVHFAVVESPMESSRVAIRCRLSYASISSNCTALCARRANSPLMPLTRRQPLHELHSSPPPLVSPPFSRLRPLRGPRSVPLRSPEPHWVHSTTRTTRAFWRPILRCCTFSLPRGPRTFSRVRMSAQLPVGVQIR